MEFGPCQKGARHPAGSISTNEPGLRCHVIRRSTCRESKSVAAIGLIANFWIMEQFDDEGRPGGTRRRGDSQIPCTYILAREICGRSRSFECRKKFLFRISPVAAGLAWTCVALSQNLAIYFDVPVFDLGSILILSFVFCLLFRLLLPSFIYNSLGTLGYFYSLPPSLSRARACSLLSILPRAFWYKSVEPIDRATNRSTETLVYFAKAPLSSRSSCSWTRKGCLFLDTPSPHRRTRSPYLAWYLSVLRQGKGAHTHTLPKRNSEI